jgi:hypothetical protein
MDSERTRAEPFGAASGDDGAARVAAQICAIDVDGHQLGTL